VDKGTTSRLLVQAIERRAESIANFVWRAAGPEVHEVQLRCAMGSRPRQTRVIGRGRAQRIERRLAGAPHMDVHYARRFTNQVIVDPGDRRPDAKRRAITGSTSRPVSTRSPCTIASGPVARNATQLPRAKPARIFTPPTRTSRSVRGSEIL